jgi:predicted metal-dependent hydrolase
VNGELRIGDAETGAVERHFAYQNAFFDYHLIREDRKTVAASVLPSQAVVVKAPLQASDDRIDDFLRRKFRWVLKQKRYFAQFKAHPEKRYVSGETFRYRGRSHKLLIRKNRHDKHVSLQHGTLTVFTALPKQPAHSKDLLDVWYRDKAHKVFSERLDACLPMLGYDELPELMIKQMTRRWGSYSQKTNRVILNQELIKAATRHIDYVIIHELCHVTHKQHSRPFYDLLASKLPQWQRLKTELELSLLG